ncbi:MAG: hypothetical protein M3Z84_05635, partial [Actinomycetota bacterium]|nr:hypothetical protein [Actinomycetota bacterium]
PTTPAADFHADAEPGQYDSSMHKARITVTIDPTLLAVAEDAVDRGRAPSVSAWVNAAMKAKAGREDLGALLAEMEAENGPPSEEDQAWAREVLGL